MLKALKRVDFKRVEAKNLDAGYRISIELQLRRTLVRLVRLLSSIF